MNLILNLHSKANVRQLMNITDAEAGSKPDFSLGKYVILMDMVIGVNICE